MPNNNIQLLIELGVSDTSRDNINNYIKSLKNLSKVEISLDVDNLSSTNKSFNETNKIIEDLQEQVKQLKSELKGLGSTKLGINGLEDFKKEIGKSIKSIGDLEEVAKKFNGDMTLTYKTVTKIDPITDKEYKDNILKSINATMQDVDGRIKTLTFTPVFNEKDVLTGIDQVSEKIKNVDFKDFDTKVLKVEERLRQLGRQGYISSNQIDDFYTTLEGAKTDKSVSVLERLNQEMTEFSNRDLHNSKLKNAMDSIKNDVTKLINQLETLNNIDGIDKSGLSKVIGGLSDIKNATVQTDAELKKLNVQFDNIENSAKDFIKEGQRISKVNGEIEKLHTTIAKLQGQGSLSLPQANKFLTDIKSVEKTTEAVKQLENQINKTANETTATNKIKNAMEAISPTVDRLNEKLDIMVKKLGGNVNSSNLEKIRNEIQVISDTKITTVDEIAKLNNQLSQTEKSITQLGVASNASSRFEDQIRKAEKALAELEQTGYSTESKINEFKNTLQNIPTGDLAKLKSLINDIDDEMSLIARNNKISETLQKMVNELSKVEAQFDKTKNLYQRTFNREEAEQIAKHFDEIRKSIQALPKDTELITKKHLDELSNGINNASISVKQFNANATTSVRNSLGMVESLKTAFEKFPVK